MNVAQIENHIKTRQEELERLVDFWNKFNELNNNQPLKKETYQDVQAKVSSRMAYLERSIRDHENLL